MDLCIRIMSDNINADIIRSDITGDIALSTDLLPDNQSHYFKLFVQNFNSQVLSSTIKPARKIPTKQIDRSLAVEGKLPPTTAISLSWRSDLLQRLSAHFPPLFK